MLGEINAKSVTNKVFNKQLKLEYATVTTGYFSCSESSTYTARRKTSIKL